LKKGHISFWEIKLAARSSQLFAGRLYSNDFFTFGKQSSQLIAKGLQLMQKFNNYEQ